MIAIAFIAIVGASACGRKQRVPGQLIVAIDTDMALPTQIDTIELDVIIQGTTVVQNPLPVGPGADNQPIPATLTLVAGPDPTLPVTIRVLGIKNGIARTLRQVITTVPADRIATLRMPVQWLCDGSAQAIVQPDGSVAYQSTCGAGATCKAGECVVSQVPETTLEDYQAQQIFGGGSAPQPSAQTAGTCFDTVPCMVGGGVEAPDDQCTVALPAGDPSSLNVALRVAGDGICDTTGTTCFVPLDGNSAEGWTVQAGRIALPAAVCSKLRGGLVAGVVVSSSCATKTLAVPPCGDWSSVVASADAAAPGPDASASPAPVLVAATQPEAGAATVCCPLTADGSKLYSCLCNGGASVQVIAIDPTTGAVGPAGSLAPQYLRSQYQNVVAGGNLYWADRTTSAGGDACPVYATPVAGGAATLLATVKGDIYDGADLLADASAVYALADNLTGLASTASSVQAVRVDRGTGQITTLDTGGAMPVLQFTQDASALYVAVDTDVSTNGAIERVSRVASLPKGGGAGTTVAQRTLTTTSATHGGFVGLQDDGTTLFALYEAPASDGTIDTQVLAIAPATGNTTTLYHESVDPTVVRLRLLGAAAGAVLLVRDGSSLSDGGVLASSSESAVLVIPPGGGAPRIAASFSRDTPVFELQAPTFSPDVFWINASGRLFRLPAAGLM